MKADDLNAILAETGVATNWQGALWKLGLAVARVVAPAAFTLLERLLVTGSQALLKRLQDALLPDSTVDTALDIARGIERDHGPGGSMDLWPGTQRAEYVRDAIRQWMIDQGGNPDDALVNEVVERAVGRLRAEQAKVNEKLADR